MINMVFQNHTNGGIWINSNSKTQIRKKLFFGTLCLLLLIGANSTSSEISDNIVLNQGTAKNVILMIGDGMGSEQVKLARLVEHGILGQLAMEKLPISLNVSTNNLDGFLTDSASSATAYATGSKTDNYRISKCNDGTELKSITEIAQNLGMKTGVVTTTRVTHATPAAFGSHETSRNNEASIASQLVDSSIDVVFGGGAREFDSTDRSTLSTNGYNYITTEAELESASGKTWGLFTNSHMNYETLRNPTEPTVADMTQKAIELLENTNGFFLMVEGGRIDHAGHDNDPTNIALEAINFDKAVKRAHDFAKQDGNTIVIVTADHETGGMQILGGSPSAPLPISGNDYITNVTARVNRVNQISIGWTTGYHTSVNVPFYAYGLPIPPTSEIIENTVVFDLMKSYIDPGNTVAATSPCQKIVSDPIFWTTGLHVGDVAKYKITKMNIEGVAYIGVALNGTIQAVAHRTGDAFEIEVLSINETVIMYQKTLFSEQENAAYHFDPQPIFRTLIHEDYSTAWPLSHTFTYDNSVGTWVLPAQFITTNQTLLSEHFYDHIWTFSSTETEIILSTTNWVTEGVATFTFNSDTGLLKTYSVIASCCDQLWELTDFESTFTTSSSSPDLTSSETSSTSSSTTVSSSKSNEDEEPGFQFYSMFITLIILRQIVRSKTNHKNKKRSL